MPPSTPTPREALTTPTPREALMYQIQALETKRKEVARYLST